MTPKDFQERLQRSLNGELSEEEAAQLYRDLLADPKALEEFLAARSMDHDLRRLLAPEAKDDAFLRGVLNARSTSRQDTEAFVRSVTRAWTAGKASRKLTLPLLLAAAAVVAVVALWFLVPTSSAPTKETAIAPKPAPERAKIEEPPIRVEPEPKIVPERPKDVVPAPEKRSDPVPPPSSAPSRGASEGKPPPPTPAIPEEKPKPAPEAAPAPPKPAPRPTVTAYATLQKIKGEVFVTAGGRKSAATDGQPLSPGQGVLTEGGQSSALLSRHDATRVTLGGDTQIAFADGRSEIALFQGKVDVEAEPMDSGREVLFTTTHAAVRSQTCRFTLTSGPLSTGLQVHQGAAVFTNVWDGKTSEVKAGQRVFAQDPPGIDRKRIDDAIRRGVAFLRKSPSQGIETFGIVNCDELMLLTLLSAGMGESDSDVQKYLKNVLASGLSKTYLVSLQAMALEELDRVKYQDRIAECAQFLVDNQCANGQWSYSGEPSKVTLVSQSDVATPAAREAGPDLFGRRSKANVVRRLQLKKTRDGLSQGDNSNAQYAALGLRACSEAGIAIPAATIQRAADWWRKCQYPDPAGRGVATGELVGRGWCYNDGKNPVNGGPCCSGAYASMTAGAVSSLMIYDHLLGADWKKDLAVRTGMAWMTIYFTVSRNLNMDQSFKTVNGGTTPPETYLYYSLYALERVGIFSAQEKLGRHPWFAEGARYILGKQKADGSWNEPSESSHPTWDTCFAILFLRRATRPLEDVPSVDRTLPKEK
jgi:hypothetical protein